MYMFTCYYIYVYVCVYIYIYIYATLGAKYYMPEITNMTINWNMSLNMHWTISVKIHCASDNPVENATDK